MNQNGQTLGQIEIADFSDQSAVTQTGRPATFAAPPRVQPASGVEVAQGKLESSNVGPAESAVRLVAVMRQFEMLQKAATLGSQMNQRGGRRGSPRSFLRASPEKQGAML